jgi:hypothetical protein
MRAFQERAHAARGVGDNYISHSTLEGVKEVWPALVDAEVVIDKLPRAIHSSDIQNQLLSRGAEMHTVPLPLYRAPI